MENYHISMFMKVKVFYEYNPVVCRIETVISTRLGHLGNTFDSFVLLGDQLLRIALPMETKETMQKQTPIDSFKNVFIIHVLFFFLNEN